MARYGVMGVVNFSFGLVVFPCALYYYMFGDAFIVDWKLFSVGGTGVYVSLLVDGVSLLFGCTVVFIAANVYLFGVGYMEEEVHGHRFTVVLFLFIVSMGLLVFSPNFVGLLLGWDGLGLTSFLLVVYYQNAHAAGAGLVTALTNRIGDVGIILSVAIFLFGGVWHMFGVSYCWVCVGLIIVSAITKSAQFPFCSWLPLAMAAPTPVSALVHSSTLVTAGVYLLVRFFPLFSGSSVMCSGIFVVGAVTSLLAGLAAFTEFDFKKVVAYSTLSQLGVMMVSLGLGQWSLAFFHLLAHAMFKALLFICVGVLIFYHGHAQDLRYMGNLGWGLPVVQAGVVLASLALCGAPFMSGFYSKDAILECSWVSEVSWVGCLLLTGAAAWTAVYSARAVGVTHAGAGLQVSLARDCGEIDHFSVPIGVLSVMSVVWGGMLNWVLVPVVWVWGSSDLMGCLPLGLIVGSLVCFWWFYSGLVGDIGRNVWLKRRLAVVDNCALLEDSCVSLWFLSCVTSQYLPRGVLDLGFNFLLVVDQGWLEYVVSQGGHEVSRVMAQRMRMVYSQEPLRVLVLGFIVVVPLFVILMG